MVRRLFDCVSPRRGAPVKECRKEGIGIAKDKLGLRPGVMVETDEIFAVASEEMALHDVTDSDEIEQIAPGETRAYTIW